MDCIDLFKRAAMALQTDPRYLTLDQARKLNDNDEELQNMIGEFNLARMDLNNEIGKSERSDARISELNEKVAAAGTQEALDQVKAELEAGTRHVFDVTTFTVEGKQLDSYMADVDTDPDYTPDTEAIKDGYFAESSDRSAPYFNLYIDGITLLDQAF